MTGSVLSTVLSERNTYVALCALLLPVYQCTYRVCMVYVYDIQVHEYHRCWKLLNVGGGLYSSACKNSEATPIDTPLNALN